MSDSSASPSEPSGNGSSMLRAGLSLLAAAAIVLVGVVVVVLAGLVVRPTAPEGDRQLAATLSSFRKGAAGDVLAAVKAAGGEPMAARVEALDPVLWPVSPPQVGWSWLVSTALPTVAGATSARPLTGFYNPWADVLLVLEWRRERGRLELADLDVVPADCVRRGGKPPFAIDVAWVRPDRFPPLALQSSVTDTTAAFERLFPNGAGGGAWRARLAPGGDETWSQVLRPAAGLLCARALLAISEYRHPEPGEPAILTALRPTLDRALAEARAGRAAALVEGAPATPAASRSALARAPLGGLAITSILVGKERAYAFAVDPGQPGGVVSFTFDAKDGPLALVRLDVVGLPVAPWLRPGGRS